MKAKPEVYPGGLSSSPMPLIFEPRQAPVNGGEWSEILGAPQIIAESGCGPVV
jgi:hypothetical protein